MCATAAHLVDHVFPDLPVRQWVLSVPFELRRLLARRADAFGKLISLFAGEVLAWLRAVSGIPKARGGGVTFPQRFGGSLNLNTHVHAVFPDGVFVEAAHAERARFIPVRPPTSLELSLLCERVRDRFVAWLERRGLVRDTDDSDDTETGDVDSIDACARLAQSIGELGALGSTRQAVATPDELAPLRARKGRYVGEAMGFSLHAGVSVGAGNSSARELLFRYCARPPLSVERMSLLPDGRIAYALRRPWRRGQTHRILTPLELLARVAALIPPPRHPLIRFHGVFAPNFRWRAKVVPLPTEPGEPSRCSVPASAEASDGRASSGVIDEVPAPRASTAYPSAALASSRSSAAIDAESAPPRKKTWWIDWATLLRRVYDFDALACPCGGRLRAKSLVTDETEAREILSRLGLPTDEPPVARARDPALDIAVASGHDTRDF